MKALIKVGYACNEHCSFCHTQDVRHIQADGREIESKIRRAAELGHSMIVLSGGEPTIRPELVPWAELGASLGLDFGLVTNGQMLRYPDLVDRLVRFRLRYVYLSLHGGTPKIHNLMVRSDAYDHAVAALQNLSGRGIQVCVNCVVTKHNLDHLRPVVDLCLLHPELTLKFSMVEPKGGANHLFDHLVPEVGQVAERVRDALAYGASKASAEGPRFVHGGIPLCLLPGHEDQIDDLRTHGYRTMVEVGEPDLFPVDDLAKVHPPECRDCALRGPCPGLYRAYMDRFGAEGLGPRVGGTRANSFHWTLEGDGIVAHCPDEAHCPLRDGALGITPWDRARDLFVRSQGKVARYRCETRDFSDVELTEIKHGREQVYLDASRKPAPTNFAEDLVPLTRSRLCTQCAHRDSCTGLYEPVLEDRFTRDDAHLRRLLSSLRGRVLDVGCGEGPYAELFRAQTEAGHIEYLGVDPDAQALERIRSRWPEANLRAQAVDELEFTSAAPFDHVLILRSWNHLPDPQSTLCRILPHLRAGGSLIIVDNGPFGLARGKKQALRAEASSALREHHRNDHLEAALHRLEGLSAQGYRTAFLERVPVRKGSSNQWLVHLRIEREPTLLACSSPP